MKIQVLLLFLFISQTIRGGNLPIKNDYLIQSQEINVLSDSSKNELSSLIYKYKTSKNTLNQYEILDQIISNKQKNQIEKQRMSLEQTHQQLFQHNLEILQSIQYAKRIQNAILKPEEHVSKHLPAHFIFFKPKDIVSGDFYWAIQKKEHLYVAAVDCTGHGVPGAFMSMLGISFLNEINTSDELLTPSQILNDLRGKIIKELSQDGTEGSNKDGMDASLVRFNLKSKELMWSDANNPLWIVPNLNINKNEAPVLDIIEYKAKKQPIGYSYDMTPFEDQSITVSLGDKIYLFSDGYPDQFGGELGKKLKYKPFKELLVHAFDKPMDEQKQHLKSHFNQWKGKYEQVDDVLVIGLEIS